MAVSEHLLLRRGVLYVQFTTNHFSFFYCWAELDSCFWLLCSESVIALSWSVCISCSLCLDSVVSNSRYGWLCRLSAFCFIPLKSIGVFCFERVLELDFINCLSCGSQHLTCLSSSPLLELAVFSVCALSLLIMGVG